MNLLDGKKCAQELRQHLKIYVKHNSTHLTPTLAIITVGENEASKVYVRNKNKAAKEIGIQTYNYLLDSNTTLPTILSLINMLNHNHQIHGILVQMPLPEQFTKKMTSQIIEAIDPSKDVDGFHPNNLGHLFANERGDNQGHSYPIPCTPKGISYLLKANHIDVDGKNIVIIGRSIIVGKPLAALLTNQNATVTLTHSHTTNLSMYTKNADIIIVAVGKPKFLTGDMIKSGAILIDVGINRINHKLIGDIDADSVDSKAKYLTPVPGGVGPMTVAMLMDQLITLAKNQM